MDRARIVLQNLDTLHVVFRRYRSHDGLGYWFRGQADSAWELLPRAGRKDYYLPQHKDLGRFNAWRKQAVAYCSLPASDIEQLAVAHHHGFATRLMDWSMNPLVACYFACAEHFDKDGVIFVYEVVDMTFVDERCSTEAMSLHNGVLAYRPKAIAARILSQKGLFTIHCDARTELTVGPSRIDAAAPKLVEIVIPAGLKHEALGLLEDYGVDRSVLFPDLDGLSAHVNYKTAQLPKRL